MVVCPIFFIITLLICMIQLNINKQNKVITTRGIPIDIDENFNMFGGSNYVVVLTSTMTGKSHIVPARVEKLDCCYRYEVTLDVPNIKRGEYVFKMYSRIEDTKFTILANVK